MYSTRKLSDLQVQIMSFVIEWGDIHKKPIPIRIVIDTMGSQGHNESRTVRAFRGLVKKRYLRKAHDRSSRSSYVRLRSV